MSDFTNFFYKGTPKTAASAAPATPTGAATGATAASAAPATPASAASATPATAAPATPATAAATPATAASAASATPATAAATPAKKNEILERIKNLEKEIADTRAENDALKKKVEMLEEGGHTEWEIANGLVSPTVSHPVLMEDGYEFHATEAKTGNIVSVACFVEDEAKKLAKNLRLPMPEPGPVWVKGEIYDGLYYVDSELTFEQLVEIEKARAAKKAKKA